MLDQGIARTPNLLHTATPALSASIETLGQRSKGWFRHATNCLCPKYRVPRYVPNSANMTLSNPI